jgi:glycosyltransferase involved in cell wall biosynthesis
MNVGIDIRVVTPPEAGQQRYLCRLGMWLAERNHSVQMLTVKKQRDPLDSVGLAHLHDLHDLSRNQLRRYVADLDLDVLLLNPERSRSYRGIAANVLRTAYGTEHYKQKLRSFQRPAERMLRGAVRWSPLDIVERRWERAFYEDSAFPPTVIAQSQYMRDQILESYRIPAEHVHVIHNAVDTSEYSVRTRTERRAEMRSRWGLPDDAFCVLFMGHNFRLKGLWELIDAIASLRASRRIHLLVAGRGTGGRQRATAKRLVREAGLTDRVIFAGPVLPSIDALSAADALAHLSWHDSFGFVALEAMACGLPVVTTRWAGASELVEDGTSGLIVDPGDPVAIAGALERLSKEPGTCEALGRAAAAAAAGHDEVTNFADVEQVFAATAAHTTDTVC